MIITPQMLRDYLAFRGPKTERELNKELETGTALEFNMLYEALAKAVQRKLIKLDKKSEVYSTSWKG